MYHTKIKSREKMYLWKNIYLCVFMETFYQLKSIGPLVKQTENVDGRRFLSKGMFQGAIRYSHAIYYCLYQGRVVSVSQKIKCYNFFIIRIKQKGELFRLIGYTNQTFQINHLTNHKGQLTICVGNSENHEKTVCQCVFY